MLLLVVVFSIKWTLPNQSKWKYSNPKIIRYNEHSFSDVIVYNDSNDSDIDARYVSKSKILYSTKRNERIPIINRLKQEARIMHTLSQLNPNVFVIMKGWEITKRRINVIMEYCESDAFQMIELSDLETLKDPFVFMGPVIEAVYIMHTNGVAHGDIKPENVFYCNKKFKLGDFDFSTHLRQRSGYIGTIEFMAFEFRRTGTIYLPYKTFPADIFALGATLGRLYDIMSPTTRNKRYFACYDPLDSTTWSIVGNSKFNLSELKLKLFVQLIQKMTACKPENRPTIDLIIIDPFFA